jgi:hypothetical protein
MPLYGQLNTYEVNGKQIEAIKVTIPNPPKVAYVRLPTTAEMLDYFKQKQTTKNTLSSEELTLALFNKIRLDEGVPFDEWEAQTSFDTLTFSRGSAYERVGDNYVISVDTPLGNTKHTLAIPTQKQLAVYRRNATKNYLNAVMGMYKELVQSVEGYIDSLTTSDVPPLHQLDCINQVFAALDSIDPIIKVDPNV